MRLIDADALKRQIRQGINPHNLSAVMAAGAFFGEVDKSPTVDAVPVVRCEECKRWDEKENFKGKCYCKAWQCHTSSEWYCALGKRREE